ncbi:GNAT family N-acetyltransferase [Mucilaginibacter sp. JRF]|uniref:GNAT family N-acetyltransferase n=1 Tax=Mucilaginibacter sp. JRF TaxID=2780088 RepID=UPI0018829A08|nr:GNAT family N-acetyltransferase [Mucilaginibacter sp. JRF]
MIELSSPRLTLRKIMLADTAQLVLLRSDERVNRYLNRPATTSYEGAVEFIVNILAADAHYWVITLKDETKLIGTICLWNTDHKRSVVEIGYELLPEFQGKGIMSEALSAVIAYNFDHLKFKTIVGTTHSENVSSIKILENNGFKRDVAREQQLQTEGGVVQEIVYSLKK